MSLRVLAVDDFEPWRRFVCSALQQQLDLHTFLEVSDGLEAVYKAENLRPDLILLDIGLPTLNGIKAASRIRDTSPDSKILFLSEESSPEVAEAALEAGGAGYVVKSDAGRELLKAINALREGRRYVSSRLAGQVFVAAPDDDTGEGFNRHELQVYSSDASFLDGFSRFIADSLNSGDAVVVIATEAHRHGLGQKLRARGFDVDAINKCGGYIPIDAQKALSSLMVNDQLDPNQFVSMVSDVVRTAGKAPNGVTRRVSVCGEGAPLLWSQGKLDTALRVEELWDEASQKYGLRTLCGYVSGDLQRHEDPVTFHKICSLHSTVTHYNRSAN